MAEDDQDRTQKFDPASEMPGPAKGVPRGARIQHFEIQSLLGQGGMGEVYLAVDLRLNRKVAIKFLPIALAYDRERVERFEKEARAASALNHPNIVTIFDTGESEWGAFIVMELIQGRTLGEVTREGIALDRLLDLALQMATAIGAAHEAGIVHRDLKPDNILVRDDGYVKVLDFGLARLTNLEEQFEATATGVIMGTLKYASPEQGRGAVVDERTDIFSLGTVFYEMASGRYPFASGSALETLQAVATSVVPPPSQWNPSLPDGMNTLILSMLEKEPAARPSARHIVDDLRAVNTGAIAVPTVRPVVRRSASKTVVGREVERDLLIEHFDAVETTGRGALVCVTGEAGFGKSVLVEDFIDRLAVDQRRCLVGSGKSSERLAGAEPYLPLLEALEQLLHSDAGGRFAREMKQYAPSWYALVGPTGAPLELKEANAVPARSQDRMMHQLGSLIQRVASDTPLVIFFDDFHWADVSTADALVYLADRLENATLMLIVTYRESELHLSDHPFKSAKLTLQARGLSRDIRLDGLTRQHIEKYLSTECPQNRFPQELPEKIHLRTGGHPLFVADLVRYLKSQGAVRQEGEVWILDSSFAEAEKQLPESVRSMVERKISLVGKDDCRLLAAAAVQGQNFDSAVISRVLSMDPADVEEQLEQLERVSALVSLVEEKELPDRTLTSHYKFAHKLYENAFFGMLRPTRRAALAKATAEALLEHHGSRVDEIAARLAPLLEAARDFERAGEFYLKSADRATAVFAHREAVLMARRGLDVALSLSPSLKRDALELKLQLALGGSLCLVKGYASQDTIEPFARALKLAEEIGGDSGGVPVIWGLWMTYAISGNCEKASELSERLLRTSEEVNEPTLLEASHYSLAITQEMLGDLPQARSHAEEVMRSSAPATNPERIARFVVDPVASARGIQLRCLALLGFSDLARQSWDALSQSLDEDELDPRSIADLLVVGCIYWWINREAEKVQELAERAIEVCEQYDIFFEGQWAAFWRGWALTESGATEEGFESMRAFLDLITSAGTLILHSLWFAVFAEALVKAQRPDEARDWVQRGLDLIGVTGQRHFESELCRIRGELETMPGGAREEGEASLRRALEIATRQDARLLEVRAALSLASYLSSEGATQEALGVVSTASERATEGMEAPELSKLRSVLKELT